MKVKTAKKGISYAKGPKGRPVGSRNKLVTGSIKKILGKLEIYVAYQNVTQRRIDNVEKDLNEWILYAIEYGNYFDEDQATAQIYFDFSSEILKNIVIVVEWIK